MRPPTRYLQAEADKSSSAAMGPPELVTVDSDVVVILAALLCALICVVGLALVARCAWLRRSSDPSSASSPPNKGLKKKTLRALPKLSFDPAAAAQAKLAECPICLAEFAEGDEIRILPQCGHGFHVGCVDKWLGSHSSCPSCRQVLVLTSAAPPSRCQCCGACSDASSSSAAAAGGECGAEARQDSDANRFIP